MAPERLVLFRTRTILKILGVALAVLAAIQLLSIARQVITWILIALFLALALNPAVEFFQRHGIRRRAAAIGLTYLLVLAVIAALGGTFVPILIGEVNDLADAVPGYVDDLTEGRGRLGFLERDYHIVERVRRRSARVAPGGSSASRARRSRSRRASSRPLSRRSRSRFSPSSCSSRARCGSSGSTPLLPTEEQARWRNVGYQIYRTVGGFVSGALVIALVAGISAAVLLTILGVPYAIALGLLVALLDLIPLAGATVATLVITTIAFITSPVTVGVIVLVYFVIYQQVENHIIYPAIYSRTVQLSPLAILIAVLIGASLAGILGALVAIPVAGAIQVVLVDYLRHRRPAAVSHKYLAKTLEICRYLGQESVESPYRVRIGPPLYPIVRTNGSSSIAHSPGAARACRRTGRTRLRARVRGPGSAIDADGVRDARIAGAGRRRRDQLAASRARPGAAACVALLPMPRRRTPRRWPAPASSATARWTGRPSGSACSASTGRRASPSGPSARTSSGRRLRWIRRVPFRCGSTARRTEEHAHGDVAGDRPFRGHRRHGAGRLRRQARDDHHGRLRRSALALAVLPTDVVNAADRW